MWTYCKARLVGSWLTGKRVALFVGIGQRALGDVVTDAQVIKLGSVSAQTGLDVAQAFAVIQLREGYAKKLIEMSVVIGLRPQCV